MDIGLAPLWIGTTPRALRNISIDEVSGHLPMDLRAVYHVQRHPLDVLVLALACGVQLVAD